MLISRGAFSWDITARTMFRIEPKRYILTCLALSALLSFLVTRPAFAHRVMIFAWVEGNTVHTESKTSGGKGIKDATVSVLDSEGNNLLSGKTDAKGMFSFRPPQNTDLAVVLEGEMGHRAEWKVSARELASISEKPRDRISTDTGKEKVPFGNEVSLNPERKVITELSRQEIKDLIEEAFEKKLEPTYRQLSHLTQRGPKITEIIGGVGYIFGVVGLALHILNRRGINRES